ncbi:MAG: HD domain-containing protein [Bacteroidales bacterium]
MTSQRTRLLTFVLPLLLSIAPWSAFAQNPPAAQVPKELAPYAFLVGEWTGGGGGVPGQAAGGTRFSRELQGRVILRTNWANVAATATAPASRHDDWMIIYVDDGGKVRADYWDNEGHVIRYGVTSSAPRQASFVSDPVPAAPRFRLTYQGTANGAVKGSFEVAPPGKPEAFAPYLAWDAVRVPPAPEAALLQLPRKPQTQAVVDACREKGKNAETRHTLMVFRAAQQLLEIKAGFPEIAAADPLTVEVAAMLHDIAGGGLVNAQPGSLIARDVLTALSARQGFSPVFIDKVARIVETHHVTGTVKGKDDNPEWYVVLLADTPRIYNASPDDKDAYAKLVRSRIDELKAAIQ